MKKQKKDKKQLAHIEEYEKVKQALICSFKEVAEIQKGKVKGITLEEFLKEL